MRKLAAGTLVVALVAVVAVLLLARAPSRPAPSGPPAARASLSPPVVQFGDRVTAHVDITGARSAQVQASFAPLAQLSAPTITRSGNVLHYSVQLSCLDQVCATAHKTFRLPDAHVLVGGDSIPVTWPRLVVLGRVPAADVAKDPPPLVADATTGPVSYRLSPSTTGTLLEVLAVVLVLLAVALGGRQAVLLARERRERAARKTRLERALELAREAETRGPADRRRAVGLVAWLLARRGEELAAPAADLAWSPVEPDPAEIERLVTEVERAR